MIWRTTLLFLAYWLLAAHFLRDGHIALCILITLSPLLIFTKHKLILRGLQLFLLLAVFVIWLPATFAIAEYRIAIDRPWMRMGVIMTTVMIFNFFAAWCISGLPAMKKSNEH